MEAKMELIPAILEKDLKPILEKIDIAKKHGLKTVHLDVMDGKFVNNTCFGDMALAKNFDIFLEVHLMVSDPLPALIKWSKLANVKRAIIHREAITDEGLKKIKGKIGIALNPDTPVESIVDFFDIINHILFMGVRPGWSGQIFQEKIIDKIKFLNSIKPKGLTVGLDGGVNKRVIEMVSNLNIDIINASTFFWEGDIEEKLEWIKTL